MDVLLPNKCWKTKTKTLKGKIKFCSADADFNADPDADIFKRFWETTVNYLGTENWVLVLLLEYS